MPKIRSISVYFCAQALWSGRFFPTRRTKRRGGKGSAARGDACEGRHDGCPGGDARLRGHDGCRKCRCRPKKWDEGDGNRTEVSLSSPKMGRGERMGSLTVAGGEMPAFAGMTAWVIGRCGAWRILAAGSSSRLHRTGRQPSCWAHHPRNEGWFRSRNGRARPSARGPAPKWDPA